MVRDELMSSMGLGWEVPVCRQSQTLIEAKGFAGLA